MEGQGGHSAHLWFWKPKGISVNPFYDADFGDGRMQPTTQAGFALPVDGGRTAC